MIPLYIFTENDFTKLTEDEKKIKQVLKKYKEWIVEIQKAPKRSIASEVIKTKSIEDLIKTSEELNKPILHLTTEEIDCFYVVDEEICYTFLFHKN